MSKNVVMMSVEEAEHYTEEKRAEMIAAYMPHDRDARALGVPVLGSGRVFPVQEETIRVEPFLIPPHWPQINGMDFGWDHPFGAVNCAWDRDADVFYVTKEYREREATPLIHSAAVKPWGDWIPTAWPHDGLAHDKGSGEQLALQYSVHGLAMLPERATFTDGHSGVEAGLLEMLERMQTGRWKVFSSCGGWFGEFRLYHREDGKVVKLMDDLIAASRYALMMKRWAVVRPVKRAGFEPRGAGGWMA